MFGDPARASALARYGRAALGVAACLLVVVAAPGLADQHEAARPAADGEAAAEAMSETGSEAAPATEAEGDRSSERPGSATRVELLLDDGALPPVRTPLEIEANGLTLSLHEAIQLGLERNLDIQIERHGPLLAGEDQAIAWSAYEPVASAEIGYLNSDVPTPNPLAGPDGRNTLEVTDGRVGVSGLVPYVGATLSLDIYGAETIPNESIISSLSPQYDSSVELAARVPVLRGLIWNQPWTLVKTSELSLDVADEGFRARLMDIVVRIESAYWNLVASRAQAEVAEKSFETSKALLDQVQTQYEVGVVSRVEVIEAEAGVAEREFTLIQAENRLRTAHDLLIDEVLGPYLDAGTTLEILPADDPQYVQYEVDVEAALDRAMSKRPELRQAEREIEIRDVNLRFARNQRLPQVDLIASYNATGLSGDTDGGTFNFGGTPLTIPPRDGSLSDSFDNISDSAGGDVYTIRGVVSIPIGNYGPRHSVSRAELELRRAKTRLARTRQQVTFEVRDRARLLEDAQRGIEASERRRVAAEEQLRAERIRLEHGESTPFDVLLREEALVSAESQKIASLQTYRTAAADLQRAQGSILEARNILIEEVAELR